MEHAFAFVLIAALLLGVGVFAQAEGPDWAAAYSAILDEKRAEAAADAEALGVSEDDGMGGYALYDIDKDGVPELIVKAGTCEADFHGFVYTFSQGEARCVCDDLGLGHCSLYSDPGENGMILMYGQMGYAWAERMSLGEDGALHFETLYEDNLNERLQSDPDADYVYPGEVVPGAAYLDLFRWGLHLPLRHYEEIQRCLAGEFPGAVACGDYPQGDPEFFDKVMAENREVVAVSADGYTHSPGRIGFRDLLKQDAAADWMYADLRVLSAELADLNGDGQPECIVELDQGEGSEHLRFFLSEQDGTVYAYLQNYVPKELTVDRNGNLLCSSEYYTGLRRLLFDGEEAMLLTLPTAYYAA